MAVDGLLSWAVELSPPMSASILRFFPRFAGLILGHSSGSGVGLGGEKLCLDMTRVFLQTLWLLLVSLDVSVNGGHIT